MLATLTVPRGAGNGTFITQNLYSLVYNYASDDGNDAYYNGIEDYNNNKADVCGEYTTYSQVLGALRDWSDRVTQSRRRRCGE
jgi:hypothetical protein